MTLFFVFTPYPANVYFMFAFMKFSAEPALTATGGGGWWG
jgi:hypothetical protein